MSGRRTKAPAAPVGGQALRRAAETVIIPVQDVLGLDNGARMNVPGVAEGNWGWRLPPGALKALHARRLHRLAQLTNRIPPGAP